MDSFNFGTPLNQLLASMLATGQEEIEFDTKLPSGVETTWRIELVRLTDEEGNPIKDTIHRLEIREGEDDG